MAIPRRPNAKEKEKKKGKGGCVKTYRVALRAVLKHLLPQALRELTPKLQHRVAEHDDGLDLRIQRLGHALRRGVHDARALRVADE